MKTTESEYLTKEKVIEILKHFNYSKKTVNEFYSERMSYDKQTYLGNDPNLQIRTFDARESNMTMIIDMPPNNRSFHFIEYDGSDYLGIKIWAIN